MKEMFGRPLLASVPSSSLFRGIISSREDAVDKSGFRKEIALDLSSLALFVIELQIIPFQFHSLNHKGRDELLRLLSHRRRNGESR